MLKFVYCLSIKNNQAGFLHIYILAVCKGLYLPSTGHTKGASHRDVWKKHAEHWTSLWASWGHLQEGYLWQLIGSLADRVHKVVNRIYVALMSSKP